MRNIRYTLIVGLILHHTFLLAMAAPIKNNTLTTTCASYELNSEVKSSIILMDTLECFPETTLSLDNSGVLELNCTQLRSDTVLFDDCRVEILSVNGDTSDPAVGTNILDCSHVDDLAEVLVTVIDSIDTDGDGINDDFTEETCISTVTVLDNSLPIIRLKQDVEVYLNDQGYVFICLDEVDDGISDNCSFGIQIKHETEGNWKFYDNEVRNNNCVVVDCRDLGKSKLVLRIWNDPENDGIFGPREDDTGDNRIDETDSHTGTYIEYTAEFTTLDSLSPVLKCPDDMLVPIRHNDCHVQLALPDTMIFDNCDPNPSLEKYLLNGTGDVVDTDSVPVGEYTGMYVARDNQGNADTCYFQVQVIDPVPPVVRTWQNLVLSFDLDGCAYLCADQVDNGSDDNCSGVGIQIKLTDEDNWKYYDNLVRNNNCVKYTCRDIGANTVWIRVWDDADGDGFYGPQNETTGDGRIDENDQTGDNYNESWAIVIVEDTAPPEITCTSDIILACAYESLDFVQDSLGEVRSGCYPYKLFYQDSILNLSTCTPLEILREWTARKRFPGMDRILNTADDFFKFDSCTQILRIIDTTPVSIVYPSDITLDCTGSPPNISTTDLTRYDYYDDYLNTPLDASDDTLVFYGQPIIDFDCEQINTNYVDRAVGLCLPAGYRVERTWTIIDWCDRAFEKNHTQTIEIQDASPPVLSISYPDTVLILNNNSDCAEFAEIQASATDRCGGIVTIINDSPYGNGDHDASGRYPLGTHRINFTASDNCGNVTTKEISFIVLDRKAPVAVCSFGISLDLNANCEVVFYAKDLDAGSQDNCTDREDLRFEIAVTDVDGNLTRRGDSIIFGCEASSMPVALIVTDEAGHESQCNTVIKLKWGACFDPLCDLGLGGPGLNVYGDFITEDGEAINDVNLYVDGSLNGIVNGTYAFNVNQFRILHEVTVEGEKVDEIKNGVNTLDLILIRQHILRTNQLSSKYNQFAADVNKDNNINTLDMIQVRQVVLGQLEAYTSTKIWQFIPSDYVFLANSFEAPTYADIQTSLSEYEQNFIGIKMGDVNGDADLNRSVVGQFEIRIEDRGFEKDEELTVSFKSDHMSEISGYQFTVEFETNALEYVEIKGIPDYFIGMNNIEKGLLSISVDQEMLESNDLFELKFKTKSPGLLSDYLKIGSEITIAEAYNRDYEPLDVNLEFEDQSEKLELHQNKPNPFSKITRIGFDLVEDGKVELKVFDTSGRMVKSHHDSYLKGYNEIVLKTVDIGGSGVYFYQLKVGETLLQKKMLIFIK